MSERAVARFNRVVPNAWHTIRAQSLVISMITISCCREFSSSPSGVGTITTPFSR